MENNLNFKIYIDGKLDTKYMFKKRAKHFIVEAFTRYDAFTDKLRKY